MKVLNIFSKRQAQLRGEVPDVFFYEKMPQELRVQVVYIFKDYIGDESSIYQRGAGAARAYESMVGILCREYGVFRLPGRPEYEKRSYIDEFLGFILAEENVERVLDAVELGCRAIDGFTRSFNYLGRRDADKGADAALGELNHRFKSSGFGYRYESGNVIGIDSELVHAEVVKPALSILHDEKYRGAEAEFHQAYEHYRHGNMKEALTEALKSIESIIKAIALKRGWSHSPNATVKPLLDLVFEKQLIPQFWAQHFSGLRAMLESGVPTARNRLGGHGQGAEVIDVPAHLVSFVLHQTASAIVFLACAEQSLD